MADTERFFHWEIAFPNVWSGLSSDPPAGGFDAVIGNPPYVRQELLSRMKPTLKRDYKSFDGMADLYVYFYEQGLRLLRPGGRLSYVVTNKWLKAGYAENLRGLFAEDAWVEFVADFGHAKHFFPDADVFPSVLVVQKPERTFSPPTETEICVIPSASVPRQGLSAAVVGAIYPIARTAFKREGWMMEPPAVIALLEKIRRNGVPLAEQTNAKPMYGIKTGLNEAFLMDRVTRDRLVARDPQTAEIIRPYLRGQDIDRWVSPDPELFMAVVASSADRNWPWSNCSDEETAERAFSATYPGLHEHLKSFESYIDPLTGKRRGLRWREDQGRFWWELRPCSYYDAFAKPKIMYVDITWNSSFSFDVQGFFTNNTSYFLSTSDPSLLSVLNSPIGWWYAWRVAQHGKDEALRFFTSYVEIFPVPKIISGAISPLTSQICELKQHSNRRIHSVRDWLALEFGFDKRPEIIRSYSLQDSDTFMHSIRSA